MQYDIIKPRRVWAQDIRGQWRIDILSMTDTEYKRALDQGVYKLPNDWKRCQEFVADHGLGMVSAVAASIAAIASIVAAVTVLSRPPMT